MGTEECYKLSDRGHLEAWKAERPEYPRQREQPGPRLRGVKQNSLVWQLQESKGEEEW